MDRSAAPQPESPPPIGHSTNRIGIPTQLLASVVFNDHPQALRISGVRETNPVLFRMLGDAANAEEAAEAFQNYMNAVFGLDGMSIVDSQGRRRFRSSYLRLLQGWGHDSNGPEGAVLKGWVESRFGLLPNFHKQTLGRYPSEAWMVYTEEKMSARFHNNSIHLQLELLYEYCQWTLARMLYPGEQHLTLYRGVNGFDEHPIIERTSKREAVVRTNNLVSFTHDRDVAGQFGDTIMEARVPIVKIVALSALLPGAVLKGEGEFLVIGGDYRVKLAYF